MALHLLKLSAGTETLDGLRDFQAGHAARFDDGRPRHVTRMWPKRADAVLDGGSIYWVIKGLILARQRILAFEPTDRGDGITRCGLVLDPALVATEVVPRRPFQGWRYLPEADAPADQPEDREADALPPQLAAKLAEMGVR